MTFVARSMSVRSIDVEKRTIDFVASTDAVDSYGEIVEQTWILDRFKSNPVILFAHDSRDLTIGKATRVEVLAPDGRDQLECTIQFAKAIANPKAEQVFQLFQEDMLRAVSVGFVPREVRYEKRDGQDVYVLAQNELHEISVVPIPANPEALAKMRARAAKQHEQAGDGQGQMDMNLEEALKKIGELETRGGQLEKAHASLEKENTTLKTSLSKVEKELETTADARDKAIVRADKAEAKVIEADVEALIGKKLLPAEREEFVELAQSNRKLFDKIVAKRPDLKLDKQVMSGGNGELPETSTTTVGKSASDDLADAIGAQPATAE